MTAFSTALKILVAALHCMNAVVSKDSRRYLMSLYIQYMKVIGYVISAKKAMS
jgi:hypothetical protein